MSSRDLYKFCFNLWNTIRPEPTKGIDVDSLKGVLSTLGGSDEIGISLNNRMFLTILETFLMANDWGVVLEKKRGNVRIRGVAYWNEALEELAGIMRNGVVDNPITKARIRELSDKGFYEDKIKE